MEFVLLFLQSMAIALALLPIINPLTRAPVLVAAAGRRFSAARR